MLVKMEKIVCQNTLLMEILLGYLVLYIPFHNPHEIAVDDTGTVYVCDKGNDCVKRFEASPTILYASIRKGRPQKFAQAGTILILKFTNTLVNR